ncbi:hypothetical protein V8F20_005404 [Naviculisporaceae sp. PSN 640]
MIIAIVSGKAAGKVFFMGVSLLVLLQSLPTYLYSRLPFPPSPATLVDAQVGSTRHDHTKIAFIFFPVHQH